MRYTVSMKTRVFPTSHRLTPEALRILRELAHHLGVSQTAVIELALRDKAAREGIAMRNTPCALPIGLAKSSPS